ncbi:hypothetical protein TWF481_007642 [Arthrobotrys musiformis]|uniref:Uncharacterized protein n=1 Tax=Arthrobotrys musiformis TaxID=47236 RepID=A0AAV9WDD2_9PEZI
MPTTLAHSSSIGNDRSKSDLDTSKPAALSFKILEAGQQEIRPPLTPATEVDLQKSCAILVQSTGYSRSLKDASSSSNTTAQRRGNGTIPVRSTHGRTQSRSRGSRTPVGRVAKASAVGHRRNGSLTATGKHEKASVSGYVPPRRPAPEKVLPVARRVKMKKDAIPEEEEKESEMNESESQDIEKRSKSVEAKSSSDGMVIEEARVEKNKKGVKKLVNVMTGYIRPHDTASSQSPPTASNEVSPSRERTNPWEALQVKSSRRKDGANYVEALPEHLHTKPTSDEEKKNGELKRSVSKRLGNAVKEYVKPPHIDRFTPEPLPTAPASSKEEARKGEQKKHRAAKTMREYVRPSSTEISNATIEEEDPAQASKPQRTPKSPTRPPRSAKSLPAPATTEKKNHPIARDIQKASTETTPPKPATSGGHGHHNPFRLIHDYVKPSMTDPLTLQTNTLQASSHLSPASPSERRPLTQHALQPSAPYIPPKIRPRGKTLPLGDNTLSPDAAASGIPPPTRQGPIFGGGYPVKQDLLTTEATAKDKENRGPVSPGFFGRSPGVGGFRIHFSHFLHKQRSDGYDQLG